MARWRWRSWRCKKSPRSPTFNVTPFFFFFSAFSFFSRGLVEKILCKKEEEEEVGVHWKWKIVWSMASDIFIWLCALGRFDVRLGRDCTGVHSGHFDYTFGSTHARQSVCVCERAPEVDCSWIGIYSLSLYFHSISNVSVCISIRNVLPFPLCFALLTLSLMTCSIGIVHWQQTKQKQTDWRFLSLLCAKLKRWFSLFHVFFNFRSRSFAFTKTVSVAVAEQKERPD